MGMEIVVCGHEPRCGRGGLGVLVVLSIQSMGKLGLAWQSSVVPLVCASQEMAEAAEKERNGSQNEGEGS